MLVKRVVAILMILCSCLLTACGSSGKPYTVTLNGKEYDLSAEMPDVVKAMASDGMTVLNGNTFKYYSSDGAASDRRYGLNESYDIAVKLKKTKLNTDEDKDNTCYCEYYISKDKFDSIIFCGDISAEATAEELTQKGFIYTKTHYVLLFANGKKVNPAKYHDMALEYASEMNSVNIGDFLKEKGKLPEDADTDEVKKYTSGSDVLNLGLTLLINIRNTAVSMEEAESIGVPKPEVTDELVNCYELVFAAMELGEKFANGKLTGYGAVIMENPEKERYPEAYVSVAISGENYEKWMSEK